MRPLPLGEGVTCLFLYAYKGNKMMWGNISPLQEGISEIAVIRALENM
jgi:hypothetical protein